MVILHPMKMMTILSKHLLCTCLMLFKLYINPTVYIVSLPFAQEKIEALDD